MDGSKQIIRAIKENPGESRREWMLKIFKDAGEQNSRNASHQFWIQDNQPKVIYTEAFAAQKLEYIHNNPVDADIVEKQRNIFIGVPEIIIMANNSGLQSIFAGGATRSALTGDLNLLSFAGKVVETYIIFVSEDLKSASTSIFTGEVTVS